jgi:hypothetical protein
MTDTPDPEIIFNEKSVCIHCAEFEGFSANNGFPDEEGKKLWAVIIEQIKEEGEYNEYESILGLSGGVSSSYLALKIYEAGLKPLIMDVDAVWNSELAVANV